MANQQRHITITLVWVRIHCEIKNGKTRFTSWGNSMTPNATTSCIQKQDMNRERWF